MAEIEEKKAVKSADDLTTPDEPEKLTKKQEIFCRTLIENNYQKQKAAIAAGVPEKSAAVMASKWLKKVKIRERVHQLQAEQLQSMFLSENRVLLELMKSHRRAAISGAHSSEIRAMELIGKAIGMFVEKQVMRDEPLRDDRFIEALSGQAAANWADGGDAVGGGDHAA